MVRPHFTFIKINAITLPTPCPRFAARIKLSTVDESTERGAWQTAALDE